jgi:tRNA(Ile2) C34 agmatinyltransferase TiaS
MNEKEIEIETITIEAVEGRANKAPVCRRCKDVPLEVFTMRGEKITHWKCPSCGTIHMERREEPPLVSDD